MPKKMLEGVVVSDRMEKTRTVLIHRRFRHPLYEKVMNRNKKVYAHDDKNLSHAGDKVRIIESRPLSRLKRWRVVKILGQEAKHSRALVQEAKHLGGDAVALSSFRARPLGQTAQKSNDA